MKRLKLAVLLLVCLPVMTYAEDDIRLESNNVKGSTNLRTITLEGDTLFKSNQSTLSPKGEAALNDLLKSNALFPLDNYKVIGHADHLGKPEDNLSLSLRRAQSVVAYLRARNQNLKMESVGVGERQPKVTCEAKLPRKQLIACLAPNRRVEIERLPSQ